MKTAVLILALIFAVGACSPQSLPNEPKQPATSAEPACATAACFIEAASTCEDSEVTLEQPGGTFKYSSTQCTIKKTLVTLDQSENQEMKHALEGKSLVCTYNKGAFDPRWVNSLVFGLESCKGELKDTLAWLLMLT